MDGDGIAVSSSKKRGSVAISGTTMISGAHSDDDYGDASGSAYLFDTETGQSSDLEPL